MLRHLYRLALPGGRRLVVVYLPPQPAIPATPRRYAAAPEPAFDRTLAQFGASQFVAPDAGLPRALKRKR